MPSYSASSIHETARKRASRLWAAEAEPPRPTAAAVTAAAVAASNAKKKLAAKMSKPAARHH